MALEHTITIYNIYDTSHLVSKYNTIPTEYYFCALF